MRFDMRRVDDDIVSMIVVIPKQKNNAEHDHHTSYRVVGVGLTLGVLEQFHFFLFQSELNHKRSSEDRPRDDPPRLVFV